MNSNKRFQVKMVLLMLVMVLAVAEAQQSTPADVAKIQKLENQVEILTNLVHAQSNILGKFSCQAGLSSNPTSECILKIADQAKKISKLEEDLKSLQNLTKTQENDIQQLQTTVSDLTKKLTAQEKTLTSVAGKYTSEVTSLRSSIQNVHLATNTLTTNVNQLRTKIQQVAGQWPSGRYCILASGNCPAGFTHHSGYMRAISLYAGNGNYIRQGTFGDSKIKCHGNCGQYGHWTGELYINACCK